MTTSLIIGPALADASAVAILAHGRDGSPEDMAELAQRMARPNVRYILLRAPANTWYPQRFMAPLADNEPYLSQALAHYNAAVDTVVDAGIPASKLILGGFSQGACLTCGLLWKRPARYGAAFVFTGGLIGPQGTQWPPQPALKDVPVLLTCGDQDDWIPLPRVEETAQALAASGARVAKHIYPGRPHTISDPEIDFARGLIDAVAGP
jgi:phospholipase/carboxylesterase